MKTFLFRQKYFCEHCKQLFNEAVRGEYEEDTGYLHSHCPYCGEEDDIAEAEEYTNDEFLNLTIEDFSLSITAEAWDNLSYLYKKGKFLDGDICKATLGVLSWDIAFKNGTFIYKCENPENGKSISFMDEFPLECQKTMAEKNIEVFRTYAFESIKEEAFNNLDLSYASIVDIDDTIYERKNKVKIKAAS